MTYIQWVHAEPLQLVQGTEQVLPTAMIRYVVVVLARTVWTALGLVYVSGTACDGMCSVDRLGRLVRPRSGRKTRRLWPQTGDFISEDVPSPDSLRVDADRRLGHVRSRELRADGPPCEHRLSPFQR